MGSKNIKTKVAAPTIYADELGVLYSKTVSQDHKKENGQFLTPVSIACYMASLSDKTLQKSLRILDPGFGTGILTCALIEFIVTNQPQVKAIQVEAYETDQGILPFAKKSMAHLQKWVEQYKIRFEFKINAKDFIIDKAKTLADRKVSEAELFDVVISNPPYFKLSKDDPRTLAAKHIVNGQTNIYSVFMALSASLIKTGGELIFITPRSFASGNYFKLFREFFFGRIEPDTFHLFVSRKDTFTRDSVLQETVIVKGTRRDQIDQNKSVVISSCHSLKDIQTPRQEEFSLSQIIDLQSTEKILHLPTNAEERRILEIATGWNGTLIQYGIQISTGPVVSFRALDHIRVNYQNGTVFLAPLFWLHNIDKMALNWPVVKPNKGQYIQIYDASKSILIPNKNYILLRRFSSKDDKSRLIAAPYFCNFIKSDFIGVENKVNYIYRPKGELNRFEVVGLCSLLNSELFDNYFRIFNGNVNVSATELREMRLPPLEDIQEIGKRIISSNDYSMKNVNEIIDEQFSTTSILN